MAKVLQSFVQRGAVFQIMYISLLGIIAVVTGIQYGYPAVTLPFLLNSTSSPSLNNETSALFASLSSLTALIGCVISMFVLTYGRRITILLGNFFFVVGWILIASSYSVTQLIIGKLFLGFATGMVLTPSQIYIAEVSSIRMAPVLNASTSFFVSLGFIVITLLGYVIKGDWRLMAIISCLMTVISIILTALFLPESPRWLLIKNRKEKAKIALQRLRGLKEIESTDFEKEFREMVTYSESKYDIISSDSHDSMKVSSELSNEKINNFDKNTCQGKSIKSKEKAKKRSNTFTNKAMTLLRCFKLPEVWKPFVILNVFFFFQHFSGLTPLMAYTINIVEKAGVTMDPFLATVAISIFQIMGDVTLLCCSPRLGRRKSAIISGVAVSISLIILGVYGQFFLYTGFSSIPLISLLSFVVMGKMGFVDLPWSMLGELFPTKFVHILGPLLVCSQGIYEFAALQSYPILADLTFVGTITGYGCASIILTIFLIKVLPETVGKSKAEIEQEFRKGC